MIMHGAIRIETTRTNARIHALLLNTSEVIWTVLMYQTLGSAIRWCAKHSANTRANRMVFLHATLGVRATG